MTDLFFVSYIEIIFHTERNVYYFPIYLSWAYT